MRKQLVYEHKNIGNKNIKPNLSHLLFKDFGQKNRKLLVVHNTVLVKEP